MPTIDKARVAIPDEILKDLLGFRVSLYRPAALAPLSGDFEAQDEAYEASPAYVNCPAAYQATPEYGAVEPLGITKGDSVLVSDKWWFLAEQEIADDWLIVMTACFRPHQFIGRCWVVQGNSELTSQSIPDIDIQSQWVFAKLSPTDIIPGH